MQNKFHILISIVIATAFIFLFAFATLLFYFQFTRKKQRLKLQQQLLEKKYQQALLEVGMEVQEHTFQSISQEIHDNVGQMLSLAKLNLSILYMEHKEVEAIKDIRDQISDAIHQLRQISLGYQGDRLLENGLLNGIQFLVQQLKKTGLFQLHFQSEPTFLHISNNDGLFVYRIFQELMQNIIRHSGATDIWVHIYDLEQAYKLEVRDNGNGFESSHHSMQVGLGIRSIRQRAALIGADLQIDTAPGMGTKVTLVCKKLSDDNTGIGR
jgi:signal transduction histidine kinase